MDHEYAAERHLAERYVLGELNPREREDFEAHYFACPECAEAVQSGTYFADNARSVFEDSPRSGRPEASATAAEIDARPHLTLWHRLSPPLGVAAALLLAMAGYRSLTTGGRETPHMLARTVLEPAARGEEKIVARKPGQKSIVLKIDVNSEKPFPHYRVDIETPSGKSMMHASGDEGPDGALEIEVPSADLPPGHYILLVHGQNDLSGTDSGQPSGPEITRSRFLIQE